jgi:hypothetical protein
MMVAMNDVNELLPANPIAHPMKQKAMRKVFEQGPC